MAKECIDNCPRIREIRNRIGSGGPSRVLDLISGADIDENRLLLTACEKSYDCSGPIEQEVEVDMGIFRSRMVTQTKTVCGLEV